MTSPPITDRVTDSQIQTFNRDGFIGIARLIDDITLRTLRDYYDKIISREIVLPKDRELGGVTRQVMRPSESIAYFRDNPAITAATSIGRQLLGKADVYLHYDMLIFKPPMHPKPTPWHQDFAYHTMPFAAEGSNMTGSGMQFWIPLDDVDVENGCMHFIPGYHTLGMKKHFIYSGSATDEGRLLATEAFGDPDLPNAGIPIPLLAGGCTIHSEGTPHYTPPNTSPARGRRAYIFNIGTR